MITQLDTENADRDLTSAVTVLTHTPDASNPRLCQVYVALGDGAKDLDGSGGDFELTIQVGGQTLDGGAVDKTLGTAVRAGITSRVFAVPANQGVVVKVKSPNAADTDVDTTAYLYDVGGSVAGLLDTVNTSQTDPTKVGAQIRRGHALAGGNKASKNHAAANPAWVHRNEADDGDLITLTRTVDGDVETVTPS